MEIPSNSFLIQSLVSRRFYEIRLESSQEISIKIEDFDSKRLQLLRISSQMLSKHQLTIKDFHQLIYKQYIYEGKTIQRMISCTNKTLTIRFDYPKSPKGNYNFECQQTVDDKAAQIMQTIQMCAQRQIKRIKQAVNRQFQHGKSKLETFYSLIQSKINSLFEEKSNRFENQMKSKFSQCNQRHEQNLHKIDQQIIKDCKKCQNQLNICYRKLSEEFGRLNQNFSAIDSDWKEVLQKQEQESSLQTEFKATIKQKFYVLQQFTKKRFSSIQQELQKINADLSKINMGRSGESSIKRLLSTNSSDINTISTLKKIESETIPEQLGVEVQQNQKQDLRS